MKLLKTLVALGVTLGLASASAPNALADNMQILRDKIKADKKLVVAADMQLTESESRDFWPVYEAYQKDLEEVNRRMAAMIRSYAEAWNTRSMNDEKAKKLISDFIAVQTDELKLITSYVPRLEKVLPATKVARYLQLENKIRTVMKYDFAYEIPLITAD